MRIALRHLHESPQLWLQTLFREDRNLATGHRPKTKTYDRRNSQASYTDNSDKGYKETKVEDSDDGHHSAVNYFARNTQVRGPQRTCSGSADSPLSLDSNVISEVNSSPEK